MLYNKVALFFCGLLVLLVGISLPAVAQTSRGIMTAPNLSLAPAEDVYEETTHNASLYTFCVGQTEGYTRLFFPDEDSDRLEQRFKDVFQFSYKVKTVHLPEDQFDRSKETILKHLSEAVDAASEGDIIMLFFSGHGTLASNPYVSNEYYFLSSDARYREPATSAIGGRQIRNYINQMAAKGALVLVFVDTCHAEALFPDESENAGVGGIAYFGSSSFYSQTIENGFIRSTDFTESLVDLLEGKNVTGDLTVQSFVNALSGPRTGNVKPRLFVSKDCVLLHSLKKKNDYHLLKDRYYDFISRGRKALIQRDFPKAYFEFSEARNLGSGLVARDRENFSGDIKELNNAVSIAIRDNEDDPTNPIWRTLSQIQESTFYPGLPADDYKTLLSCSGMYFLEQKDYAKAFGFFERAFNYGDRQRAPYHLALIAEEYLPGELSRQEINRYYGFARENGYHGEKFLSARKQLMTRAEQGDTHAQALLGRCYYYGDTLDFRRDSVLAIKWLRLASEQNDASALVNMGNCYNEGFGVEEDTSKAVDYYVRASNLGSFDAKYELAKIAYSSEEKKLQKKAFKVFEQLAESNYPKGHLMLGVCYDEGKVVRKDRAKAQQHFLTAANSGSALSQAYLGAMFFCGKCFPKDPDNAYYWIKQSTDQNCVFGTWLMGSLYEYGIAVPQNDSLAFHYYQLAAEKGCESAFADVSRFYLRGRGVEQNLDKAEFWMRKSVREKESDNEDLADLLLSISRYYNGTDNDGKVIKNGESRNLDHEKAYSYLINAQEIGVSKDNEADLFYQLALSSEYGWGVSKDTQSAFECYSKSVELGSITAINAIGNLFYDKNDFVTALSYFKQANEKGLDLGARNAGFCLLALRDTLAAKPFFQKAAGMGDPLAQEVMGDYFYFGLNNEAVDYDCALSYYEMSRSSNKAETLLYKLGWIYNYKGDACYHEGRYEEAKEWFEKSMEVEYPLAWYNMGVLFWHGAGVEEDIDKAFLYFIESYERGYRDADLIDSVPKYYSRLFSNAFNAKENETAYKWARKGIDAGFVEGIYWLAYMLKNGIGVQVDKKEALVYYKMAYPFRKSMEDYVQEYLRRDYYALFVDSYKEKDFDTALIWCEFAAEMGVVDAKKWLPRVKEQASSRFDFTK